jgi:ArsR family transcriptional regulator
LSNTTAVLPKPRIAKRPAKASSSALRVSEQTVDSLAELFRQLADRNRLKILLALAEHGELHVSALKGLLGQSQPAVSHHLNLLRSHHLVGFRRDGKHNYYRIDSALIRGLLERFFSDTGNGHKQIQFEDFAVAFKLK